jgi:CRP/FNR family transcriptional regulator
MIHEDQYRRVADALPLLKKAEPALTRAFREQAFYARIHAGQDIFAEGDRADALALLISGVVRVYKIGETGREITLYRFGEGESCILTANAILSQSTFPALATVERDAEAVMIYAEDFREWVNRWDLWRAFFFDLLAQRLSAMLEVVEEVAFRRVDTRVAAHLAARARQENPVRATHQEIAAELGSSREVITRILADLAAQGFVRLQRGAVEVIDPQGLARRAEVA